MICESNFFSKCLNFLFFFLTLLPFLDTENESDTASHEKGCEEEGTHGFADSLQCGHSHVFPVDVRWLWSSLKYESPSVWSTAREESSHDKFGHWEPIVCSSHSQAVLWVLENDEYDSSELIFLLLWISLVSSLLLKVFNCRFNFLELLLNFGHGNRS